MKLNDRLTQMGKTKEAIQKAFDSQAIIEFDYTNQQGEKKRKKVRITLPDPNVFLAVELDEFGNEKGQGENFTYFFDRTTLI